MLRHDHARVTRKNSVGVKMKAGAPHPFAQKLMAATTTARPADLDIGCRQSEQPRDILLIGRRQPTPHDLHGTELLHRTSSKTKLARRIRAGCPTTATLTPACSARPHMRWHN